MYYSKNLLESTHASVKLIIKESRREETSQNSFFAGSPQDLLACYQFSVVLDFGICVFSMTESKIFVSIPWKYKHIDIL